MNAVFTVSAPYTPSSTAVFLNGQLKRKDFVDGWAETSPSGGVVTLAEPPRPGDVVQVFFLDASGAGGVEVEEVCPLVGALIEEESLSARITAVQEVRAQAAAEGDLSGTIRVSETMAASIEEVEQIRGVLSEVCG